MNVIGKCVAGSWITNNDTGDEDPSVVPERLAVIEIDFAPPAYPGITTPGLATLGGMVRGDRARCAKVEIDFDPDRHDGSFEVSVTYRVRAVDAHELATIRDMVHTS